MFMYMFAIPTPAIAGSDLRWPAKETLMTYMKNPDNDEMIAGKPIFITDLIDYLRLSICSSSAS